MSALLLLPEQLACVDMCLFPYYPFYFCVFSYVGSVVVMVAAVVENGWACLNLFRSLAHNHFVNFQPNQTKKNVCLLSNYNYYFLALGVAV